MVAPQRLEVLNIRDDVDREIAHLRMDEQLNFNQIASRVGLSSDDVFTRWEAILPPLPTPEAISAARATEQAVLDTVESETWEAVNRLKESIQVLRREMAKTVVSGGDLVDQRKLNSIIDRIVKLEQALNAKMVTIRQTSEQRARLLGANAPNVVQVEGVQAPVLSVALYEILELPAAT